MSDPLQHPDRAPPDGSQTAYHSGRGSTDESNTTGPHVPRPDPELPELPGYAVEGLLGRGGMGVVFKARHLALKRTVALKLMLPRADDARERARFQTEAESIARLQHPNIVQVYESGEYGGAPYFAMEYVEGGSLAKRLAGRPLPAREAARLVESLARGVHLAHSRAIVHRDLKPANVLLTPDGTPKVTDFGLARQLDADSGRTRDGAIMGTPSYMAPEQAMGETFRAGPAADVWALGAILYEAMTGRPPFRGSTVLETLEQVRTQEPLAPGALAPVPRDLETVVLKCLRKEPEARYASAAELADDLARFARGEPVAARPVGRAERFAKWVRRKPALAAAGGLALAGLAGTVIGALLIAAEKLEAARQKEEDNAEIRKVNAELGRALAGEQEATRKAGEALTASDASRRLAEYRLAEHHWRQGRARAEQGQVPEALLWWSRGLGLTPDGSADLRALLGMELDAWAGEAVPLRTLCEVPGSIRELAFGRDGTPLVEAMDRETIRVRLYDGAGGTPAGPELVRHTLDYGMTVLDDGRAIGLFSGINKDEGEKGFSTEANLWDLRTGRRFCPPLEHEGQPRAVVVTGDGALVATGCHRGTARVWDRSGKPISPVLRHEKAVTCVALSPDRNEVLTGSWDTTAKLWDVRTGECRLTMKHTLGPRSDVAEVAFSPDGRTLVTWATEGKLWLWDAATGAPRGAPVPHVRWLGRATFDPTGAMLLTTPEKNRVQRWEAKTLKPLGPPIDLRDEVASAAFSPDGKVLLTGCGEYLRSGEARLWDATTGRPIGPPMPHRHAVSRVAFAADGRRFATGTSHSEVVDRYRSEIRVWDLAGLAKPLANASLGKALNRLVFRPDGRALVAVGSAEARVLGPDASPLGGVVVHGRHLAAPVGDPGNKLFDKLDFIGQTSSPADAAYSPDGSVLVTAGRDALAVVRDPSTGKPTGAVLPHRFHVTCLAFRPDGKVLATGSADRNVRLWSTSDWKPIGRPLPMPTEVRFASWDRKGKLLLAGCYSKTAVLWDADVGKAVAGPFETPESIKGGALSPDGKTVFLASGSLVSRQGELWRWDVPTGRPLGEPLRHENELTSVALSTDGRLLATASQDGIVRLWRADSGEAVGLPMVHPRGVSAVAFSPDGRLLVTGAADGAARLWETGQARPVGPPRRLTGAIRAVAFRPDGGAFAAGSSSGELAVWPVPNPPAETPDRLRQRIEVRFGAELGADEVLRPLLPADWDARHLEPR